MELVGAAALLLTPEPTLVTKVAGGALAVHGSDTTSTGIVQVITGRTRTTLTSQAAAAAAEALGADPKTAKTVGFAVDLAVPVAAGSTTRPTSSGSEDSCGNDLRHPSRS